MYKKILVPLDGSALAEGVLPHALILAKATGAEVTFATVLTSEAYFRVGSHDLQGIPEALAERKEALRGEVRLYLEKVVHDFKGRGVVARCTVREGDVAGEIIASAEEEGSDLIAMATHGRSGIDRFLMGSIAENVVRRTLKPVLLIRVLAVLPSRENGVLELRLRE